ncbi:MAG: cupredoxin domain-containing protein [Thermomicrobiales bacterium]|nr:cupredoxin domain-containing protein [Thermomicrobiales bacterium]
MAKRFFSMTGLAVVVLIVLAACGAPQDEVNPTVTRIASPANAPVLSPTPEEGAEADSPVATEAPSESEEEAGEGTADGGGGGNEVTVVSHDIYFEPTEVHVAAGTVKFILPNEGAAEHDFSIDELGIQVNIPAGTTQELEVDIPAGTYEFYCAIPGHKDAGMMGTLVVE